MQLSIIIVNYNVKFFLEHCLLSLINACKNLTAEIIVIDNNSTDGSKDFLVPKFHSVKFIWKDVNVGFGNANNEAAAIAQGEYILFLNPDTILPENCLQDCLTLFKKNKDYGAVGVRMIDGNGSFLKESKRCLPTASSGLFKMIGLATLLPNSLLFAKYYAGHLPEKENNKVEVLAGAFMMLSKKGFEITIQNSAGQEVVEKIPTGPELVVSVGQTVQADQPLTNNPNVGGFGQTETEIVLQNPLRIFGLIAFFSFVILAQVFLVLKKKQFEKVQLAEMNF